MSSTFDPLKEHEKVVQPINGSQIWLADAVNKHQARMDCE